MLTFLEYVQSLQEGEGFHFKNAKDQDYTNHPTSILVFGEDEPEEYVLKGKAHGQMSHAIKHLVEFDKPFVDATVAKARKLIERFIQRHPQAFCKIWVEGQGFSEKSGVEVIKSASAGVLLNTLDLINDKAQMKDSFLKVETQLKQFATEMENRYKEIIKSKLDKAVDLGNMSFEKAKKTIKSSQVISFAVMQQTKKKTVWLDFSDSSIIIGEQGGMDAVNTMFQFSGLTGGDKGATIKAFFTKRLTPINPDVEKALKSF